MARKKFKGEPHVRLFLYEMRAPAFLALSGNAVKLLLILRSLYRPSQANLVFLSEREAEQRLGVSRNTARKAFAELLECGWIRREAKGSFGCKMKLASSYRLTNEADGTPGSVAAKDYMKWKPKA